MSYTAHRQLLQRQHRRALALGLQAWASAHVQAVIFRSNHRFDTIRKDWKQRKISRDVYNVQYARAVNDLCGASDMLQAFINHTNQSGVKP